MIRVVAGSLSRVHVIVALLLAATMLCCSVSCLAHVSVPGAGRCSAASPDLALISSADLRQELLGSSSEQGHETGVSSSEAPKMFLFSLAVPGAGQLVQGQKRGFLYLLVEAAFWGGFFALNSEGLDRRDEYEAYADAHWDRESYEAWYAENCIDCTGGCDDRCRPLAEVGSQEFYEDVGKYSAYWHWWSDEGQGVVDPGVSNPEWLGVRNSYWGMREESNKDLRRARYLMTAAFLNHVVSAVDAFFSARGSADTGTRVGEGVRLEFAVPDEGEGIACAIVARY